MTGHDDSNRIGAIRETNGSHSLGASDLLRKLSIRNDGAAGDSPEFIPNAALKECASRFDRYIVYRFNATRKVTIDRIPEAMRIVSRFEIEPILSIVQPQQTQHARFVVSPIDGA
jgi:hypothetical protein